MNCIYQGPSPLNKEAIIFTAEFVIDSAIDAVEEHIMTFQNLELAIEDGIIATIVEMTLAALSNIPRALLLRKDADPTSDQINKKLNLRAAVDTFINRWRTRTGPTPVRPLAGRPNARDMAVQFHKEFYAKLAKGKRFAVKFFVSYLTIIEVEPGLTPQSVACDICIPDNGRVTYVDDSFEIDRIETMSGKVLTPDERTKPV